jgi:CubicO group peptidase (beta-lactamase class C family)
MTIRPLVAVAALVAVPLPAATVMTSTPDATDNLTATLQAAVTRGDVPGAVVMAVTRDRVLYQGAFGKADAAADRMMTMDALFQIASMTKPITSAAAMQLVEQHKLSLDDAAEKYLPELADLKVFESFDAKTGAYTLRAPKTKVTVRQLFTHTSGLGYGFTSPVTRDFKPRAGETYTDGPLLFDPGTQWMYGDSIAVLGRIVEKLSGQTLEEYFREHILTPLKMTDTFFNVPEAKQPRRVTVHTRADGRADAPLVERPNQPQRPVTKFNGGGGLFSTAGDYARFERMILNGGTLDGARILSAESVAAMRRNQMGAVGVRALKTAQLPVSMDFSFIDDGKDKWGLGFLITSAHVPGKRSAGSLSWGGIDNTYFWIDPQRGLAAVILMQFLPFADTKGLALYDAFERGVYQIALRSDTREHAR